VSRWEPNARGRLEQAALELYAERGFDDTTVADIAERAGLTKRTFFRHFTDKREVLFSGQTLLAEAYSAAVAAAPASATPMDAVADGLRAVAAIVEDRGELARRRQAIVAANRELQERELLKRAALAGVIVDALRARGVADPVASLTAETAVAVFKIAYAQWSTTENTALTTLSDQALGQLSAATANSASASGPAG
jgi:AcrR family transcriptional regulator